MEKYRKEYANEIHINKLSLEKTQQRDREVLENLGKLKNTETKQRKTSEIESNINKREKNISILSQREEDFLTGRLDAEINNQIKNIKKIKKEFKRRPEKEFVKKEKNNDERDYNYYYKIFCKTKTSLPEYMRENLKTMSNNKGYIWRNCWFFGSLPPEPRQPVVMFEKNGAILYIHEIDNREHRIYEKHGKEKKKLISSVPRKYNFSNK